MEIIDVDYQKNKNLALILKNTIFIQNCITIPPRKLITVKFGKLCSC